ncbi:MAG: hypothetical protein AUF74_00300 [Thaumarchaeota archaeon 13_1_20CM_2_38_5]|nr:MAG: hypothetical protein AUF74_00300 [Thaumarchaeota archaeon 13_1_20CM_2_38_5]
MYIARDGIAMAGIIIIIGWNVVRLPEIPVIALAIRESPLSASGALVLFSNVIVIGMLFDHLTFPK